MLERIAIGGESYDEAAERLQLPLGTLRSRLHRAGNALHPIHTRTGLGPASGHRDGR